MSHPDNAKAVLIIVDEIGVALTRASKRFAKEVPAASGGSNSEPLLLAAIGMILDTHPRVRSALFRILAERYRS